MKKRVSNYFLPIVPIVSIVIVGLLSSCAQYKTVYTPPKSKSGMQCVNQCITSKQMCNNNCQMLKNSDQLVDIAQRAASRDKQYVSNTPYRGDCGCDDQYKDCYMSCGGKIDYVCVSGCDKK